MNRTQDLLASVISVSIATALFAGCLDSRQSSNGSDVFNHPQDYVGKTVRVCGYIRDEFEDQNIFISRDASLQPNGPGLGFISEHDSSRPSPWNARSTCVTGILERTGCGVVTTSGEMTVCLWSRFPYALRVLVTNKDGKN